MQRGAPGVAAHRDWPLPGGWDWSGSVISKAQGGHNQTTTSADFGRINRNTVGQTNFQRFLQLGFRLTF